MILTDPLEGRTGTVVLWQRLDRILGFRRPSGDTAARRLDAAAATIAEHLSMVFHRFLSGEAPGPRLEVRVMGAALAPWDPFARGERFTRVLNPQALPLEHAGVAHDVAIQPYVLPAQHNFSNPEAHEAASGPNRWNRQQGLYIYRRDRLIQAGGWNRLRTLDEHAKLARIVVDIPPGAESAFRINVSKMMVGLPETLRPQLRALVAGVVSLAQDVYRRKLALVSPSPEHDESPSETRPQVTTGDQWPQILDVLTSHLGDQAKLLDRLLVDLANVRPVDSATPSAVSSHR